MAKKAVVDAVETRLQERFSACPVFGINLQGETPEDGSTFVQVQYPVANTTTMDLAGTYYREEGAIRIIVNAQRGAETAAGLTLADDLAALFRNKKFGGVQTFAPSSPVIDDRNEEGMYFALSFAVPFQFDFTDSTGFYG
ncbi:pyruvate/2-oxoglutarate/acetoin dehydrogenase E1 component [Methylobacterium sp. RAS18]|nr:pyruvate/2-oxoglutarate/acetoin dehydrogenase E1 component [Methylobacterium sp. RAS18]